MSVNEIINRPDTVPIDQDEAIEVAKVVQQASDIEFTRWFA